MNSFLSTIIAAQGTILLPILYWLLLILLIVLAITIRRNENWPRANFILQVVLFILIGLGLFRFAL